MTKQIARQARYPLVCGKIESQRGCALHSQAPIEHETKLRLPQDRCSPCDYADFTSPRRFRGGHVRGLLSMSVGPMVHNELQRRVAVELIYLQSVNRMYYLG